MQFSATPPFFYSQWWPIWSLEVIVVRGNLFFYIFKVMHSGCTKKCLGNFLALSIPPQSCWRQLVSCVLLANEVRVQYLEVLQSVIVRLSQKLLSRWKIDVNKSKFKGNANFNMLNNYSLQTRRWSSGRNTAQLASACLVCCWVSTQQTLHNITGE